MPSSSLGDRLGTPVAREEAVLERQPDEIQDQITAALALEAARVRVPRV